MNKGTCANPLCKVSETGKCIEGLALDKCTKYGKPTLLGTDTSTPASDVAADISILKSRRLSLEEAGVVLKEKNCEVIAFVGPHESGKTSLIASMFDVFQRTPLDGFSFTSSLTLFAFEDLLHFSRAASGGRKPKMPHTSLREGIGFLHLGVKSAKQNKTFDLLLIDRPGEEYRNLTNRLSAATACTELPRAQLIVLLIDGMRMLDKAKRHNAISETKLMLAALAESKLVTEEQKLALALTKYDVIAAASRSERERVENDLETLLSSIRLGDTSLTPRRVFRIAALPENDLVPQGFGFEGLFTYLLEEPRTSLSVSKAGAAPERAFARLGAAI